MQSVTYYFTNNTMNNGNIINVPNYFKKFLNIKEILNDILDEIDDFVELFVHDDD